MALKSRYVKVQVSSDARTLSGYRVLGDIIEDGHRVLLLERPESTVPRKPRTKKVNSVPATAVPNA